MTGSAKKDKMLRALTAPPGVLPETPCFIPGTRIATPTGEIAVEQLEVGNRIVTRDNGIQTIRWVGHRRFGGRELASHPHLYPILVRAGSLGDGLPERDMKLSPNHRVLVTSDHTALYFEDREVLASAKHLVNNRGVFEVESLGITYVHFLFDQHEVVLADGCWCESFQPTDKTLRGLGNAQREEIFEIFPELRQSLSAHAMRPARRVLSEAEARQLFQED